MPRKALSMGLRQQLLLALIGLVVLAIGLSVAVGSATITSRYVGHLRMWQMMGMADASGPPWGQRPGGGGAGPGLGMHHGAGGDVGAGAPWAGSGRAAQVQPGWQDSLRRGLASILGLGQATAGLGFTAAQNDLLTSLNRGLLQAGALVLLLALAVGLVLARRLTLPLHSIEVAVGRLQQTAGEADPDAHVPASVIQRAPAELAALGQSFNRMVAQLAEARRQRQSVVADVAHELRTPVAALRSYAEAVRDGVLPADEQAWRTVLAQTSQLSRLVDDLMQLTLWETGQLQLQLEEVDLPALIDKVADVYRPLAMDRDIALTTHCQLPALSRPVWADGQRLAQVLHNLLANALQHTASGGHIDIQAVLASPASAPSRADRPDRPDTPGTPRRPSRPDLSDGLSGLGRPPVEVAVSNTGPPIPTEALSRLFERFYRADPSRSRDTGGAGLGLAICRQIVRAHRGQIWAENGPDGPVFRLRLLGLVPVLGAPTARKP